MTRRTTAPPPERLRHPADVARAIDDDVRRGTYRGRPERYVPAGPTVGDIVTAFSHRRQVAAMTDAADAPEDAGASATIGDPPPEQDPEPAEAAASEDDVDDRDERHEPSSSAESEEAAPVSEPPPSPFEAEIALAWAFADGVGRHVAASTLGAADVEPFLYDHRRRSPGDLAWHRATLAAVFDEAVAAGGIPERLLDALAPRS